MDWLRRFGFYRFIFYCEPIEMGSGHQHDRLFVFRGVWILFRSLAGGHSQCHFDIHSIVFSHFQGQKRNSELSDLRLLLKLEII